MVETIVQIQQMLSESKFVEAQKLCELEFQRTKSSHELREVYFESLIAQQKIIPQDLLLEHVESLLPISAERADHWLSLISRDVQDQELLLLRIRLSEIKGRTEDLYRYLSLYQVERFRAKAPELPAIVLQLIDKYFKGDFQLRLQQLALDLMRLDLCRAEALIKTLIRSCFERSSARGTEEKLGALLEVLKTQDVIYHLELYKNLCKLLIGGISEKKDFKRIIELVIYFEDFELQIILLNFLVKNNLPDIASVFASEVRTNQSYDFVYLDKYFYHLKPYFFKKVEKVAEPIAPLLSEVDLKPSRKVPDVMPEDAPPPVAEEEVLLAHLVRHQNFGSAELADIAIGFLQAEFFHAALRTAEMAENCATSDEERLKSTYLRVTCLLKLGDYRGALDSSLIALKYATTQNDVLCFLYAQADAHVRLKEYRAAKELLKKIISIQPSYRLARERLERLNAF